MIPKITQQNVRIFIPYKVAKICTEIVNSEKISVQDAILKFYESKTARLLANENSKLWNLGWVSLYEMYREEQNEN